MDLLLLLLALVIPTIINVLRYPRFKQPQNSNIGQRRAEIENREIRYMLSFEVAKRLVEPIVLVQAYFRIDVG